MAAVKGYLETGNLGSVDTQGTGWFIGFSDWCGAGERKLRFVPAKSLLTGLCVKWFEHKAGDPAGQAKPVSTGVTLSILMQESARFRIDFSLSSGFPPDPEQSCSVVLERFGDFVAWGEGVHHRAFGMTDARIMTLRWILQEQP